jgi:hypothetical protein
MISRMNAATLDDQTSRRRIQPSRRDMARTRNTSARELSAALSLATIIALVTFSPRIQTPGFNADDWALRAAASFPQTINHHTAIGALEQAAGSRIGHMLYWLASITLFGAHARLYDIEIVALSIILAFYVYLLLRELQFSPWESLAVMVLTLVAPSVETTRYWFTVGGLQISLSLFCLGFIYEVRAFSAESTLRRRYHLISLGLYLASALYAETALPLIALAAFASVSRTDLSSIIRRWLADIAIVLAGYGATYIFINDTSGFNKLPPSQWLTHANLIASQALTIITHLLGPLSSANESVGVGILCTLAGATIALLTRGDISAACRHVLRRWGFAVLLSAAALVIGYAVFVPASLYYEPLGPGLATHINAESTIPLAVLICGIFMLARAVSAELLRHWRHAAFAITVVVIGWYSVVAIESTIASRHNAQIWAAASAQDFNVLNLLLRDLPHPIRHATVYTFGAPGTVALGMPIFYTSWEQNSAIKLAYDRSDLSSYPIVTNGLAIHCGAAGITAVTENIAVNAPSRYGYSYFLDLQTSHSQLIRSAAECAHQDALMPAGPYEATPPMSWSL